MISLKTLINYSVIIKRNDSSIYWFIYGEFYFTEAIKWMMLYQFFILMN